MSVSVLVTDDDTLVRAGLVMILSAREGLGVVGEAGCADEAVERSARLRPDVVLMDLRLPGVSGIAATRHLRGLPRPPKVLVLTSFPTDDEVREALRAGASGILLKHAAPDDLVAAVRQVAAGGTWLDPSVSSAVVSALAGDEDRADRCPEPLARLTPREREVLALMAQGLSNAEIRDRLVLSEATVKTHVARIVTKTASRDRTQAVVLAYRTGLVTP